MIDYIVYNNNSNIGFSFILYNGSFIASVKIHNKTNNKLYLLTKTKMSEYSRERPTETEKRKSLWAERKIGAKATAVYTKILKNKLMLEASLGKISLKEAEKEILYNTKKNEWGREFFECTTIRKQVTNTRDGSRSTFNR